MGDVLKCVTALGEAAQHNNDHNQPTLWFGAVRARGGAAFSAAHLVFLSQTMPSDWCMSMYTRAQMARTLLIHKDEK